MAKKPNILFVMADQLRADFIGVNGHPTIMTPNFDKLASDGYNFSNAYCQAPVCGPSRMSFYTGRYARSHGAVYNGVPINVNEQGLGNYLRPLGYRVGLVGKTHMAKDIEGMRRLGIDSESSLGVLLSQCGFEPYERDDGLHPDNRVSPDLAYNAYLREHGFAGENPWHSWANSGVDENGELASGWFLRNSHLAARIPDEHSETAYMTNRAIDFIRETGEQPWCLHLSYIKPHWPYIVSEPFNTMYTSDDVREAVKSDERSSHPVVDAFRQHEESVELSKDHVRKQVIPTYMGLVSQVDFHFGRLIEFLEKNQQLDNTLIVVTADHGDYLGDYGLGEKDLFHEPSVRIPMIMKMPTSDGLTVAAGSTCEDLVESIDLVPTFIEIAGGQIPTHILEGRSIIPLLEGKITNEWRNFTFSETDYAYRPARKMLKVLPSDAKILMVRNKRWKLIMYQGFESQLYDLESDPTELYDVIKDPQNEKIIKELEEAAFEWALSRKSRTTVSDEQIETAINPKSRGIYFGVW